MCVYIHIHTCIHFLFKLDMVHQTFSLWQVFKLVPPLGPQGSLETSNVKRVKNK